MASGISMVAEEYNRMSLERSGANTSHKQNAAADVVGITYSDVPLSNPDEHLYNFVPMKAGKRRRLDLLQP